MNHRHLLPDEIDLLLDDEVGFGVNPLRSHVRDCADCRAKVEDARRRRNLPTPATDRNDKSRFCQFCQFLG